MERIVEAPAAVAALVDATARELYRQPAPHAARRMALALRGLRLAADPVGRRLPPPFDALALVPATLWPAP